MSNTAVIKSQQDLPDGVCMVATGEIDLSRSPLLRSELMQAVQSKPMRIVLEMSEVSYMDSSGVATLVETLQKMKAYGGKLVLCALQPKVHGIFQISKLDTIFAIVDDLEAAKTV